MKKAFLLTVLSVAVFALAPSADGQCAERESPAAASVRKKDISIEAEIISIDAKGEMHNVANFGQVLPLGENWSTTLESKAGEIRVQVTWAGDDQDEPALTFSLMDGTDTGAPIRASVKLEKVLWDALYGPEAFVTAQGKPFISAALGRLVAVAAVTPVVQ